MEEEKSLALAQMLSISIQVNRSIGTAFRARFLKILVGKGVALATRTSQPEENYLLDALSGVPDSIFLDTLQTI